MRTSPKVISASHVNSKVLMHFDGSNGSTSFIDVYGHTFSASAGSPALSTAHFEFGTASLNLSGGSSAISSPGNVDFGFGTGDLTVEAWVYLNTVPSVGQIMGCWSVTGRFWQFIIANSGGNHLTIGIDTTNHDSTGTVNLVTGSWHHYAWVRLSGVNTMYYDGTGVGTVTDTNSIGSLSTVPLSIGRNEDSGGVWYIDGYIDELRVSAVARYTSNFTPTGPFTY